MKKCYLIIPLLFIILFNNHAQEFGDIPDELLKITSLKEDPEEDAAIIFDKGSIRITKDFTLEIKRHIRIKVFTEEGKKQANIKLEIWHDDVIDDIEAISITPDGKEYELDNDNIFTEENEVTKIISFPIPGVEIGSVLEYSYSIRSEYISNLKPWSFQTNIYTKYSEVKVLLPLGFAYRQLSMNLERYDLQEKVEQIMDIDNTNRKISEYTWACSNLPGIKDEPYTDNIDDNYAKMQFILVAFKNEYADLRFAKTWDDVGSWIYKMYDDFIDDDVTEDLVKIIVGSEVDELKKANLIYDYVRTKIKTTEHKSLAGTFFKEPSDVIKDRSGSSSEKSMLLINMLRNARMEAKPVLISTRDNGTIIENFCDGSQFNRLICLLKIKTKDYFLYPDSYYCQFGCLTPNTEVSKGLLIEEEKGSIITIKPQPVISSIIINTFASVDSEGTLNANTVIQYSGYAALDESYVLQDKDTNIYVTDYLNEYFAEAKLDSFYFENLDSVYKPIILYLSFKIPNYLEETEELVYFPMPFFTAIKKNPFIRSKRNNPIDYEYAVLNSENIKIEIPSNYTVSQIPTKRKNLITNLGLYQVYASEKNFVECARTIDLKNRRLLAKNYNSIKSFYDDVVGASMDQIVCKKAASVN